MTRIDDATWADLLATRATRPTAVTDAWAARSRRPLLGPSGTMFLVAADHPGRRANTIGDDPLAMADRRSLLSRLVTALADGRVDGVLGTPDILDELVLLGALEDKLAIGSINRGGLARTVWELDDQLTGHRPERLAEQGLDGGKMLLRIDPTSRDSKATIEACSEFVTALADTGLMAMVEPLPYTSDADGRAVLDRDDDELIRCIGVANALGHTSAHTWLKLPATDDPERVLAATTLPTLLLGGAPGPDPDATFARFRTAMGVPQVRGLVVGRSLLYPPDGDVAGAVAEAAEIVGERPC